MIDIRYQNAETGRWYTRSFPDHATFASWKYTFKDAVSAYEAYTNYRLLERMRVEPFYIKILNLFSW